MDSKTLSLLCNPYKGEPFRLEGNELVGVASGQCFPIREGIPVILAKPSFQARNRWFRRFYDLAAVVYDPIVELGSALGVNSERQVRESYIKSLAVPPGGLVLETAAGTGANRLYLPDEIEYYGLDISWGMLRRARKKAIRRGRAAEWFQGDGAYLPFRDNTFDLVFQMGGLQFIADPFRAISEMARVARPGSSVYIMDEVGGAVRTLKRLPAHVKFAASARAVQGMARLVPQSMRSVQCAMVPNTDFYSLTFEKP